MEVRYDKVEDILMIVLPNTKGKKIDDTLEGENLLVSITEGGEPIMLEVFQASEFLNQILKIVLKREEKGVSVGSIKTAVLHQIKK